MSHGSPPRSIPFEKWKDMPKTKCVGCLQLYEIGFSCHRCCPSLYFNEKRNSLEFGCDLSGESLPKEKKGGFVITNLDRMDRFNIDNDERLEIRKELGQIVANCEERSERENELKDNMKGIETALKNEGLFDKYFVEMITMLDRVRNGISSLQDTERITDALRRIFFRSGNEERDYKGYQILDWFNLMFVHSKYRDWRNKWLEYESTLKREVNEKEIRLFAKKQQLHIHEGYLGRKDTLFRQREIELLKREDCLFKISKELKAVEGKLERNRVEFRKKEDMLVEKYVEFRKKGQVLEQNFSKQSKKGMLLDQRKEEIERRESILMNKKKELEMKERKVLRRIEKASKLEVDAKSRETFLLEKMNDVMNRESAIETRENSLLKRVKVIESKEISLKDSEKKMMASFDSHIKHSKGVEKKMKEGLMKKVQGVQETEKSLGEEIQRAEMLKKQLSRRELAVSVREFDIQKREMEITKKEDGMLRMHSSIKAEKEELSEMYAKIDEKMKRIMKESLRCKTLIARIEKNVDLEKEVTRYKRMISTCLNSLESVGYDFVDTMHSHNTE